jgi:hypothetical protein
VLWLVFRPHHRVAGCESVGLDPAAVDDCLRRWGLLARDGEAWPCGVCDWTEVEQIRATLNFARMRARDPKLSWSAVPWSDCADW